MSNRIEINLGLEQFNRLTEELESGQSFELRFTKISGFGEMVLESVEELLKRYGSSITISFQAGHGEIIDLNLLKSIPSVKALSIQSNSTPVDVKEIGELKELTRLSLSIYELEDGEVLDLDNLGVIKSLVISESKRRNVNLGHLVKAKSLRALTVSGHTYGIAAISTVNSLETLRLTGIKDFRMELINGLSNLIEFKLLRCNNMVYDNFEENRSILTLELENIKDNLDIDFFGRFINVKNLILSSVGVTELVFSTGLNSKLREVVLLNCKKLNRLEGLESLDLLDTLSVFKSGLDIESWLNGRTFPESLNWFTVHTGKKSADKSIEEHLKNLGYKSKFD